jgi:hypothetical protein
MGTRRLAPASYAGGRPDAADPVELFVRLWADYEREKERAGRLDFDDMLTRTVAETDPGSGRGGPERYGWFSVDSTRTPIAQQRLLELRSATAVTCAWATGTNNLHTAEPPRRS